MKILDNDISKYRRKHSFGSVSVALDEFGHDSDAVTGATIAVSYFVDAVKDALSK